MIQVRVAQTACMSACQHIAKSLMAMLLSEDVKQMSLAALEQVNLDVMQCERKHSLLLFGDGLMPSSVYLFFCPCCADFRGFADLTYSFLFQSLQPLSPLKGLKRVPC